MKILAVDYGASRTGLAVCDPTEFLTTPITPQITLKARPKVAAEVCRIAQEQKAELIVVGLPLNMDGTEGERAEKSRKLGKTLQIWSGLPVRMWDERQSTCEAADILDEVNCSGTSRMLFSPASARARMRWYSRVVFPLPEPPKSSFNIKTLSVSLRSTALPKGEPLACRSGPRQTSEARYFINGSAPLPRFTAA